MQLDKMANLLVYDLYKRYENGEKLSPEDDTVLIDGLLKIIRACYRDCNEADKIYIHTESFSKKNLDKQN